MIITIISAVALGAVITCTAFNIGSMKTVVGLALAAGLCDFTGQWLANMLLGFAVIVAFLGFLADDGTGGARIKASLSSMRSKLAALSVQRVPGRRGVIAGSACA
jgi:hypothetical protein